jgi:antitoxin YefM
MDSRRPDAFLNGFLYLHPMVALSLSDARANLKAVMDRVCADKVAVSITRRRAEGVVMISQSEWDSIQETLYLLQSPANAKALMESIAGLDAGKGEEHELIEP